MRSGVLDYSVEGSGPVLVLSHSLAIHRTMWEPQLDLLRSRFTVVNYDIRGHGRSEVTEPPYTMEELAGDALGLLDAVGAERAVWVGLSLGGMIGLTLTLAAPDRIERLVLADTTSGYPPAAAPVWRDRVTAVESGGMAGIAEGTLARWFTGGFRAREPEAVDRVRRMILATDPRGFLGCARAIMGYGVTDRLSEIACPTLVVVGAEDTGTPPAMAEIIAAGVPGAELVVLQDAAHLSNIEQPEAFNAALARFLSIPAR